MFDLSAEAKVLEKNLKKGVLSFLVNSTGTFNNIAQEADKAYNHLNNIGNQFQKLKKEAFDKEMFASRNENYDPQQYEADNTISKNLPKNPVFPSRQSKDQDIYDL